VHLILEGLGLGALRVHKQPRADCEPRPNLDLFRARAGVP